MAIEYSEKVLDHFKNPRNLGELKDANAVFSTGSPACGDQITLYLKIDEKTKLIKDIKFKSYGCASNIATASIVTELVKGKTKEYAKNLTWKTCCDELDGLPPVKVHCSILAIDTLKGAIKEFEKKFEGLKTDDSINEAIIREKLRSVANPQVGSDIISSKQVNYIGIDDKNNVIIEIMPKGSSKDAMDNIISEIKEHLLELKKIGNIDIRIVEH
jgi:nitrogen fixation protein NifU and related proteins